MKITQPKREIEVCDHCHREGFLTRCWVCGGQYCLTCDGTVARSWGFTDLCRACAKREDVVEVCRRYADQLTPIYQCRRKALIRLGEALRLTDNSGATTDRKHCD